MWKYTIPSHSDGPCIFYLLLVLKEVVFSKDGEGG